MVVNLVPDKYSKDDIQRRLSERRVSLEAERGQHEFGFLPTFGINMLTAVIGAILGTALCFALGLLVKVEFGLAALIAGLIACQLDWLPGSESFSRKANGTLGIEWRNAFLVGLLPAGLLAAGNLATGSDYWSLTAILLVFGLTFSGTALFISWVILK
ncbi:MAG: hypothetical protein AAGA36_11990 [Pseudomonadota bacterium]